MAALQSGTKKRQSAPKKSKSKSPLQIKSQPKPSTLTFKSNEEFFEYLCKEIHLELRLFSALPAMIMGVHEVDANAYFEDDDEDAEEEKEASGETKTVLSLKVHSKDGGFMLDYLVTNPENEDAFEEGDVVLWVPTEHMVPLVLRRDYPALYKKYLRLPKNRATIEKMCNDIAPNNPDLKNSWLGCIVAQIKPEIHLPERQFTALRSYDEGLVSKDDDEHDHDDRYCKCGTVKKHSKH